MGTADTARQRMDAEVSRPAVMAEPIVHNAAVVGPEDDAPHPADTVCVLIDDETARRTGKFAPWTHAPTCIRAKKAGDPKL